MSKSEKLGEIVLIFLSMINQLKLFHFQTHSYARHKSSDKLVENLMDKMDKFMEVIQGTRNLRLKMPKHNYIVYENNTDKSIISLLKEFKKWLLYKLPKYLKPFDKDLTNIRDEILADVNQTLYLFTFV